MRSMTESSFHQVDTFPFGCDGLPKKGYGWRTLVGALPQAGRGLVARIPGLLAPIQGPRARLEVSRLGPQRPVAAPRLADFSFLWWWLASWQRSLPASWRQA